MEHDNCSRQMPITIRTRHYFELEWAEGVSCPSLVSIDGHDVDPIAPAFDRDTLSVPSLYGITPPEFPQFIATAFTADEIKEMERGHFSEPLLTRIRDDLRILRSSSSNTLPKID